MIPSNSDIDIQLYKVFLTSCTISFVFFLGISIFISAIFHILLFLQIDINFDYILHVHKHVNALQHDSANINKWCTVKTRCKVFITIGEIILWLIWWLWFPLVCSAWNVPQMVTARAGLLGTFCSLWLPFLGCLLCWRIEIFMLCIGEIWGLSVLFAIQSHGGG